jgi:hypothetical protein
MRLTVFTSMLVSLLLAAGCSDSQSVKGAWDCNTNHPGGHVSSDIFNFSEQGTMTLDSDGVAMHGRYTQDGATLTMHLLDVPIPDPSGQLATQPQTLTATIQKKSSKVLEMDVSTGSDHHLSKCRGN